MDKQLIFFLFLAFMFIIVGAVTMEITAQIAGIVILCFTIFNKLVIKENEKEI